MSNEKQESVANNAAAMREALEAAHRTLKLVYENAVEFIQPRLADEIIHTGSAIESALAAPPRNCDIGTAEEQTTRYRKFCASHKYLGSDFSHVCKGFGKERCPFFNNHIKSQCEFAWAQTPYTEEGAK